MLKCWRHMKLIIWVLSSRSLRFYARKTILGMTLNSQQPLHVEVWGLCLLQLNYSYRNLTFCVGSEFHLLKMPYMFSKAEKNSDSLLELFCFILTIWFSHTYEISFASFYRFFFSSSVFTSVSGASQTLSIETLV